VTAAPGEAAPGGARVRPASEADAPLLAAVHAESISSLGAKAYPPEVVAEWIRPCTAQRYLDQMARGETYFLAFADGGEHRALGFSSYRLEEGRHRTAVYVAERAARRGVGSALFAAAEAAARAVGAQEIDVSSSLAAVDFYRARGFEELSRGLHHLRSGRGSMACVFMRKRL
jgi:putative acetyltransferase